MHVKSYLFAAVLGLAVAACDLAAADQSQCTVAAFEADASAVLEACAVTLRQPDLPTKARAEALKIRGLALHRLKQLDAAAIVYEHALTLDPTNAEITVLRGRVAYYKYDLQLAMSSAEQAVQLDPASAGAYDLLGSILLWIGQFDASRAAYERAISLNPRQPLYRYHLLEFLRRTKLQREALAQADILLTYPEPAMTLPYAIGYEGVRTSFKTATRLERGRLLRRMGRFAEAQAALDELVRDAPSVLAYTFRGQFRAMRYWPHDQVMADLDRARQLDPDYYYLYDVLGRYHFFAKRYEEASKAFRRQAELRPNDGEARWWHAMSLRGVGRLDEAKAEAVAAVDVDVAYILRSRAKRLHQRGYLPSDDPAKLTRQSLHNAARACMIDPRCW